MEIEAIQRLIETDEKIRREVKEVYDKRAVLMAALEDEKKQMASKAWVDVNQQVDDTKVALDEKIKSDDQNNQSYYQRASKSLQQQFDEKKEAWRNALYQRIVGEERKS